MDEPSEPVWDMFVWSAMSWLWSCAALVSLESTVTGEQPAFSRSALTRVSTRAVGPESVSPVEVVGVVVSDLVAFVALGAVGGEVVLSGVSAVSGVDLAAGLPDFDGDALGLGERDGRFLRDGVGEALAEASVADGVGVRAGSGAA